MTTPTRTLWDFIQLGNRQSNQINTNFKLAYRASPQHKVTLEAINNRSIITPYNHMWSRQGYVQVNLRHGPHHGQSRHLPSQVRHVVRTYKVDSTLYRR